MEFSKTYWNGNGELQEEYNAMLSAEKDGTFTFTKNFHKVAHSYYRYFNDGDLPGWARGKYDLTKSGRWGAELNNKGELMLEGIATIAIQHEWNRYQKKLRRRETENETY